MFYELFQLDQSLIGIFFLLLHNFHHCNLAISSLIYTLNLIRKLILVRFLRIIEIIRRS